MPGAECLRGTALRAEITDWRKEGHVIALPAGYEIRIITPIPPVSVPQGH
jgi:hypothetical protein